MKIKLEHFEMLKKACDDVTDKAPGMLEQYKRLGFSPKRYRWDILWASTVKSSWISENLYPYMDDTHIDTALRNIVNQSW